MKRKKACGYFKTAPEAACRRNKWRKLLMDLFSHSDMFVEIVCKLNFHINQ